jgi:catechol 2,3-dioxygenase-like lactoylglutathione lyase family enzyme
MKLRHVALVYGSAEDADRFMVGVLGLAKGEPRPLPAELARAVFGLDHGLEMVNYMGDGLLFEVFIGPRSPESTSPIRHVCLEVDDVATFLERCERARAEIRRIPRGDSVLVFLRDTGGNLFEIKEKKPGV